MTHSHILQSKSGLVYYCRLVGRWSGLVWNTVSGAMEENPAYANTAITVTDITGDGDYAFDAPAALPEGSYKVSYRLQAGVSPANTDMVIASVKIKREWDSKITEEA